MDILKRELAPITSKAWETIDQHASARLRGNLSARRELELDGPHGWELGAVNLGRLRLEKGEPLEGLHWGVREVQPLIETRIAFHLKLMELDSVSRGLSNPDLSSLEAAAHKAACFEEKCIYLGFAEGGIRGMLQATTHAPVDVGGQVESYPEAIEAGVVAIQKAGIGGPFHLILGTGPYQAVMAGDPRGYPLVKRLASILGGKIHWSPALKGGAIFSSREGNYRLTLGQDFSIGYASHTRDTVELYIAESFTFQVLDPAGAVEVRFPK